MRLYDMEADPGEICNVIEEHPEIAEKLRAEAGRYKTYDEVMVHERWVMEQLKILMKCDYDDPQERWQCGDLEELENPVCSKKPFQPTGWAVQMKRHLYGRC